MPIIKKTARPCPRVAPPSRETRAALPALAAAAPSSPPSLPHCHRRGLSELWPAPRKGGGEGKGLWFPVLAEALRFQAVDGAQRPWRPPGGEARVVLGRRWCDAPGFELALLELMIELAKVKHVTLVKPWSTCVITPENLANNH
jgi:hypothetical protein